jgi:hypothetical protein
LKYSVLVSKTPANASAQLGFEIGHIANCVHHTYSSLAWLLHSARKVAEICLAGQIMQNISAQGFASSLGQNPDDAGDFSPLLK